MSLLDDIIGLSPAVRFAVHGCAALFLLKTPFLLDALRFPLISIPLSPFVSAVCTILIVLWVMNLYNFMDGMDGFAGGMAVIGFTSFALLGLLAGNRAFSLLNAIMAAAALGFLVFNFHPARLFMGDVGSVFIGYWVAVMMLVADYQKIFPLWVGVLVFSPFIVDATVTLLGRVFRGEKFWIAHKTHYYQRLVESGWGHQRTVILEYVLMVICGSAALISVRSIGFVQWGLIAVVVVMYIWLGIRVGKITIRREG